MARMVGLIVVVVSVLWWWWLWAGVHAGPAAHLISALPGQPSSNVRFAQYGGYIAIQSRDLFYYFVEAQSDPSSKPLTLWLPGGPACSVIANAFSEMGPFRVTAVSGELIENPFAWNKESNMLFLEMPAGVGWSYSNLTSDLITNDTRTAQDNFAFLLNWFEEFPEYKGREFYIAGESYAGHYAPQLAVLIVDYIAQAGNSVINFKAMAIGNPLLYGPVDFRESYFFLWTHGAISDSTYTSVMANCNFSVVAVHTEACEVANAEAQREVNFTLSYDVLIDVCHSSLKQKALDVCLPTELVAYMNLPAVQKAFHANTTGIPYRWYYCNEGSLQYDNATYDDSMLPVLSDILKAGVPILIWSGDQDSVIPFGGTRRMINELAKMTNLNTTVPYSVWFQGQEIGGWTQVYGPLSYATVRGGGHIVAFTSPAQALTLFKRFLAGVSLPLTF